MKYIFNQFQGLGDILFCEPIAKHFYKKSKNEIVWPVNNDSLWLKEYFPYINFVPKSNYNFNWESTFLGEVNGEYHVPLRFANPIYRNLHPHDYSDQYHTMLDKYRMLDLPLDMWKTLKWDRKIDKEETLYNKLVSSTPYILVNNYWSDGVLNIQPSNPNNYSIVYMNKIEGFSLLDWAKIIEEAKEIYTASTSNLYILENLPLKATKVSIYPRKPRETTFEGIEEIVSKHFNLIK